MVGYPMQTSRSREMFLIYPVHNCFSFRLSVVNIIVDGEKL
jgi:hypothetical protein